MTPKGIARLMLDENAPLASSVNAVSFLIDDKTGERVKALPSGGNATIGFGLNLSAQPLDRDECELLLTNRLTTLWADISRTGWIAALDGTVAGDVVLMVEYNTGDVWDWPQFLAHLKAGDIGGAANELMNSKAANEAPERYQRMASALVANNWP